MIRWIAFIGYIALLIDGVCIKYRESVQCEFIVQNADGEPVQNAEVYLVRPCGNIHYFSGQTIPYEALDSAEAQRFCTKSAADGRFRVDMQMYFPHRYNILVSAKGYYMTVLPLVSKEQKIVLLDRERVKYKKAQDREIRRTKDGPLIAIWKVLHGCSFWDTSREKDEVVYMWKGRQLPMASVYYLQRYLSEYPSLDAEYLSGCPPIGVICPSLEIYDKYNRDKIEDIIHNKDEIGEYAQVMEAVYSMGKKLELLDKRSACGDFYKLIPVFFQYELTPEVRKMLSLTEEN